MQQMYPSLAHMPVQNPASRSRNCVRQEGEYLPDRLRVSEGRHSSPFCSGVTIIRQQLSSRSQSVFENNQAVVVQVRTATIDLLRPRRLTLFDESPEQKRHATEIVKSFVGAPIFVNHGGSVLQGEHSRDWNTIFPSQPDLQLVTHAREQVSEPGSRLWEQLVASSGSQQKPVEFVHKSFRMALFIGKSFSFCPLDLSSKRILM